MKKQIKLILILVVLVILGIFVFKYESQPATPVVGADGDINGNYAIEGVMALKKPYICNFEKADETSKIVGTIHINGKNFYGEFRIKTDLVKNEFSTFLLGIGGESYIWTSLGALGYKSPIAKSAGSKASPEQQAQIIGTRDIMNYQCQPWQNVDESIFQIPTSIKFSEIKN